MFENIDSNIVALFLAAMIFMVSSFFLFFWKKNIGLLSLIFGTFLLGLFMASLDPFLHAWDEQQHALVAKNMMEHPFKPMLYKDPVLPYLHSYWIQNHIWLHKQPLFLWQMALSMKIFGTNVLAMRLPSVVMFSLLPLLVYRIGKILKDEKAGFVAAFFMAIANFPLELVAGRMATDHNDVAFLFYLTLSLMCWFEYQSTGKKMWLILLGISAGAAVLVKWLMGLLVYVIWFLTITAGNKFQFWNIRQYFVMIKPFVISVLVFLPWQIYCLINYPREWKWEMEMAGKHFGHVIEGHNGDWTYHFDEAMGWLYFPGDLIPFILLIVVGIAVWRMNGHVNRIFILFQIAFVYLFFTLAATKMIGFTLISLPLVLVSFGICLSEIINLFQKKIKIKQVVPVASFAVIFFPAYKFLNVEKIQVMHSDIGYWGDFERVQEMNELYNITELRKTFGDQKIVIFNANTTTVGSIQYMFFSDYIAYPQIPVKWEVDIVLENDLKPILLDRGNLYDSIPLDPRLTIFPVNTIY